MGDYFGYIAAAYGISGLAIAALIAGIALDAKAQRTKLDRMTRGSANGRDRV